MATTFFPITAPAYRLRLPQDGPLIGATSGSDDGKSVITTLFATPDDSESDPALALLASYLDAGGKRQFAGAVRTQHPDDPKARAPYFVLNCELPVVEFAKGHIKLEVLTLHEIKTGGTVFSLPSPKGLDKLLKSGIGYDELKKTLETRLQENQTMLDDPKPESHSFERRSDRSLDEAVVTLRLPPKKEDVDEFKFIATTCRYPGFAFESQRVDAASFDIIAKEHSDASGLLMLGDQIYADATANLFDNLTSIEKFQARYHKMFRSPGFAKAVRAIPCYMTGDDHEFSDSWSVPDNSLRKELFAAAQQSYGIYQLSHSPFKGKLDTPPFDYFFTSGPVAVYVMDTLSNRNTQVPGEETIVSADQLAQFKTWLHTEDGFEYVILASGGVVAPGFKAALDSSSATDVSRAQGLENWQAFNRQRIALLDIIADCKNKKILLVSGDYHCAAMASIKNKDGNEIAKAVVVPPAYAPMRYVSKTIGMLAPFEKTEKTGGYEIALVVDGLSPPTEGSGFAVITIEKGDWVVKFETMSIADT